MNRQNFLPHLALALTFILIASFAGQLKRTSQNWHSHGRGAERRFKGRITPLIPKRANEADVLVRFRSGVTLAQVEAIAGNLNDHVEDNVEFVSGLAAIDDDDGLAAEQVAEQYRSLPEVEYAEPNFTINLSSRDFNLRAGGHLANSANRMGEGFGPLGRVSTPDDPMFGEQWSLDNTGQREGKPQADISALRAWDKTKGTDEVVIAVLDSGVDYTHPDLFSNMWFRPADVAAYVDQQLGAVDDQYGYNAVGNDGDPMDQNGHGTHCAGIIGAEGGNNLGITGINWHVQIMPLKFMSAGGFGTTKDAIECINYVIDRKRAGINIRVISASWGSTQNSRALEDAIRRAGEEDILFIAASGNASADADKTPHYPASYNLPNVLSIAALNRQDQLASFSNYGAKSVHIAAPGAEILSTWLGGEYEEHSGTSMATPEVAGVAGLVLAVESNLSVTQLRERLLRSVDKLGWLKGKVASGGRINAARAVEAD